MEPTDRHLATGEEGLEGVLGVEKAAYRLPRRGPYCVFIRWGCIEGVGVLQ